MSCVGTEHSTQCVTYCIQVVYEKRAAGPTPCGLVIITRLAIHLSLVAYAVALLAWPRRPSGIGEPNRRHGIARVAWTLGLIAAACHVLGAYHFAHDWSHQKALAHVAEETYNAMGWRWSGGVYFNFVFLAIWAADAVWWWVAPDRYLRRATTVTVAVHAYLLFIVVNATIVFESGVIRWVSIAVLAVIALRFFGGGAFFGFGSPRKASTVK